MVWYKHQKNGKMSVKSNSEYFLCDVNIEECWNEVERKALRWETHHGVLNIKSISGNDKNIGWLIWYSRHACEKLFTVNQITLRERQLRRKKGKKGWRLCWRSEDDMASSCIEYRRCHMFRMLYYECVWTFQNRSNI